MSDPDALLERLLAKPVAPATAQRQVNPDRDFTTKIEVTGDTLTAELRDDDNSVNEGTAQRFLVDEGQDPSQWEVTGFRKIEYGAGMQSVRFTYKRVQPTDIFEVPLSEMPSIRRHKGKARREQGDHTFVVALGDMQFGKGLKSSTPILTTDGWVRHGDLAIGMSVYGADGKPKRVLDVLETTERDLYEVEFGDGSIITCDADHIWSGTRRMHPAGYGKPGVPDWEQRHMQISLRELEKITNSTSASSRPFVADASGPVEMPERELPIEPHLFGLWLGDGASSSGRIAKGRVDADLLLRYGYETGCARQDVIEVRVPGLTTALRGLGVLGAKRVPSDYLFASVEQRLALVQGLMDTDGHATERGACEFSNTNKGIADAMMFLLRSLGMRPRMTESVGRLDGVEKSPYWRITFRATMPVFTLERKLARVQESSRRQGIARAVRAVRPIGTGEAQCITVEGGLYLAGEELVVTHNCDGDGVAGTLHRTIDCINKAADALAFYRKRFDIGHVHIAWLGDHIEGFSSQGGANVWRTPLGLDDQLTLARRTMIHALTTFADQAERVSMAAVPGNHGEPQRFAGKGVTRYDDSHDTGTLIAVSDAAALNPEAFGHVEFYVPQTDELTVALDLSGTVTAHAHGHVWRPGKHFEWWRGQAFNRQSALHGAHLLLAGHLHHEFVDSDGDRTFIQPPAMESESTWWRHSTGTTGAPGLIVAVTGGGHTNVKELIR